jgi:hypothetical protein
MPHVIQYHVYRLNLLLAHARQELPKDTTYIELLEIQLDNLFSDL